MRAFSTSIDLQGMDPSITRVEKDLRKDGAVDQKQRHEFVFDELKDKNGLFVIDIQGNGKITRAVIKKGSLTMIYN